MSKVTSKYQVSIPKTLAERLEIAPGDDVEWRLAGGELRVRPASSKGELTVEQRLEMFDSATRRQTTRNRRASSGKPGPRGWTREELYDRGRAG